MPDAARDKFRRGGDDLALERRQRKDLMHIGHVEDHLLDPRIRQRLPALDYIPGRVSAGSDITRIERGLLDLRVIPPDRIAMPFQHVQFFPDRVESHLGKKIAGIRILGDQQKRFLLAAPADEDRGMRFGQRLRIAQSLGQPVILAVEPPVRRKERQAS